MQMEGQNIGRVGEEIAAKIFAHLRLGELGEILGQLRFARPPGEVGVALVEAGLGQRFHHFRAGESLGEKDCVRKFLPHAANEKLPKSDRFGVRIIDPENAHALFRPEEDNALHFLPQLLPGAAAEIERVNVLVFFRRIFGVFDRAVGALVKPLRVFRDIGMVGRAVDRKVERDLHAATPDLFLQPGKILQRA